MSKSNNEESPWQKVDKQDTEEFLEKISKKEEFSPYIHPLRRHFFLVLDPHLKNVCLSAIYFNVKLSKVF